jgi:hypothetical protein
VKAIVALVQQKRQLFDAGLNRQAVPTVSTQQLIYQCHQVVLILRESVCRRPYPIQHCQMPMESMIVEQPFMIQRMWAA